MNEDTKKLIDAHREETHQPPSHLVEQWHNAIDEAAAMERGRASDRVTGLRLTSLFWGVAITAALAVGIGIGMLLSESDDTDVLLDTPILADDVTPPRVVPAAFTRGLQVHLRDSQQVLASLDGSSDTTMLALQIIEQNRLFELAAVQNNAQNLARVLRAFEPILLELAATDIAPEDAKALRTQLSFELSVMLTKLASQSSDESTST